MAQERGFDLVEVAPMAQPPVVRFLDFGQYKYELTKREKEAKRKQRSVTFKEVRLTPKIGVGDFDTKVHRAIEFLEDGDRIKVTVRFRGRELTHPEIGRDLLARFVEQVKDHGVANGRRCSKASRCTSRWHRSTSPRATTHRTASPDRQARRTPWPRRPEHRPRCGVPQPDVGRPWPPRRLRSPTEADASGGSGRRTGTQRRPAPRSSRAGPSSRDQDCRGTGRGAVPTGE